VTTIPNQGKGAAMMRVEAVRRVFPQCWFNKATTEAGLDALGFYHERRDDQRGAGLGPSHDWSSHCADAFGLMAICYEAPDAPGAAEPRYRPYRPATGRDAWLGG
jgi:phage terminase large subunit